MGDFQLQQNKPYLAFTCSKLLIKHEACLKLKLKYKSTQNNNIVKRCSIVFIVNFERISYLLLPFLLFTLNI